MINDTKKEIVKSALDKIKLVDAGVKDKYGYESCGPKLDSPKERVYYPNISLDSREAPMLVGVDTGEKVTLLIEASVVSHSLDENRDRKNERFTLEIKKIGVVSTDKKSK
ncbi:MAG: hypothetical protein WC069_05940 [Candidatus Shapirobacteria bacterium]